MAKRSDHRSPGMQPSPMRRISASAALLGLLSLTLATAVTLVEAVAHHPGSHAKRQQDRRVRLEVAVTVPDSCTTVGAVRRGVPTNLRAPAERDPVIVQLTRPDGALCAQVVGSRRGEAVLDTPDALKALHLFVLGADGRVIGMERVPVE